MFFGRAGRPVLRDFHRQNILNAFGCHLRNVSGFTITNVVCHSKNWESPTIVRGDKAVVRRGLALPFVEQGELFSQKQILGY